MDKDILVLPDTTSFDEFLKRPEHAGRMRHVVITHGDNIAGVLRINTALRHGLEDTFTGVTLGEIATGSSLSRAKTTSCSTLLGACGEEKLQ